MSATTFSMNSGVASATTSSLPMIETMYLGISFLLGGAAFAAFHPNDESETGFRRLFRTASATSPCGDWPGQASLGSAAPRHVEDRADLQRAAVERSRLDPFHRLLDRLALEDPEPCHLLLGLGEGTV